MNPTTKLVTDMVSYVHLLIIYDLSNLCYNSMQACYINTTHPDFLNGHKAMAIVQDRLNANKPPPPQGDPKAGKLAPGQINNNKDLDVEIRKEEPSFFGSFFSSTKGTQKKKGVAAMDAVSGLSDSLRELN